MDSFCDVCCQKFKVSVEALTLREMHRFANCLQKQDGFDTWDIDALEAEIRTGLNNVCNDGIRIDSIGIDTWGVDYVRT